MPRRRMIDPDFWTDSKLGKATRDERLLFIGLFSNADDEGRIMADPPYLKSIIFPYDDDITSSHVREMRDHLAQINSNVILYQNSGEDYIQLKQWDRHQKPRYPKSSKFPPPADCTQKDESLQLSCTQKDEGLQPSGVTVLDSIGKVSLNTLKGFSAAKEKLNKSKNKVGFLVDTFKAYHAHAPPADFENLGGRLAGILKTISNDYNYLLKLIWDSRSIKIAGSHLNYIQGNIRGAKSRGRRLPTDEERERSLR